MGLLLGGSRSGGVPGQVQRLPGPVAHDGLGPQLVPLLLQIPPHALGRRPPPHVDGQEAAVAGLIPQVVVGIGGAEEDAAARDVLHVPPVGRPELIGA